MFLEYRAVVSTAGLAAAFLLSAAPSLVVAAPTAREQELICRLSNTCDQPSTDADTTAESRDIATGERTFTVVKGRSATGQTANSGQPGRPAAGDPKFYGQPQARPAVSSTAGRGNYIAPKPRHFAPATPRAKSADVRVAFANSSAVLNEASREDIRAFANVLQSPALASASFVVEGHTNSVGGRDYNVELSQRRAQAVRDYLIQLGVSASRLEAKGFGFDKPRTKNPADAGNRRVEIVRAN